MWNWSITVISIGKWIIGDNINNLSNLGNFKDESENLQLDISKLNGQFNDEFTQRFIENEDLQQRKMNKYWENYVSEETVFKKNIKETKQLKTKSKTQLEKEKSYLETPFKSDISLENREGNNQKIISRIVNFNTSTNLTYNENMQSSILDGMKFQDSEGKKEKGRNTERNNKLKPNFKKTEGLNSENQTIITKKCHPFDQFLKRERMIISKDINIFSSIPMKKKFLNRTMDYNNALKTRISSRADSFQCPVIQKFMSNRTISK